LHPQNNEIDSLAQQVEHIPFKDGVLGSNPKRITFTIDNRLITNVLQSVFSFYSHICTQKKVRLTQGLTLKAILQQEANKTVFLILFTRHSPLLMLM
jgi:hypothetical protein